AEPSLDDAARLLREVRENATVTSRRAQRGRQDVLRLLGPAATGARMRRRLESLVAERRHGARGLRRLRLIARRGPRSAEAMAAASALAVGFRKAATMRAASMPGPTWLWVLIAYVVVGVLTIGHFALAHPKSVCACVGTEDPAAYMWALSWWPH